MSEESAHWLYRERWLVRGLDRTRMAQLMVSEGKARGEQVPSVEGMCRNLRRWEEEGLNPEPRFVLLICAVFNVGPEEFPGPGNSGRGKVSAAGRTLGPPPPGEVAYRGVQVQMPDMGVPDPGAEHEVVMAAHEAGDRVEEYEQHGIGDATAEQLCADIVQLAGLSDTGSPLPAFQQMRRVRDRIYRIQDRRLWPSEQEDLHFMLGALLGLMGIQASRLGFPDASEELIRAGIASATVIGHRPLLAQLRQQLSSVAFVRGRIRESDELALAGLEHLSEGQAAAHLHLNHARAAAVLGDADAARRAVGAAHEAREREYDNELLAFGGEFTVSLATHHALAGAALAGIPGAEGDAAAELERSVSLYEQGPGPGEEHWFGGPALAGLDLAFIRLRAGDLEAGEAALSPVMSLPPDRRIADFGSRLALVRAELAAPVFRGTVAARQLGDQIEEFGREADSPGLRSLPAGPG